MYAIKTEKLTKNIRKKRLYQTLTLKSTRAKCTVCSESTVQENNNNENAHNAYYADIG